jgi:hypothetical protein
MGVGARAALLAATEELYAVTLDPEFRPPDEGPGQALQLAVGELHDQTTAIAYQVVAMVLCDPSVVAVPMLHMDVLDQAKPFQEVHRAVHARQAHLGIDQPGAPVDLGHLEVLRRSGQDLQHGHPRSGDLVTLSLECFSQLWDVHVALQLRIILNTITTASSAGQAGL